MFINKLQYATNVKNLIIKNLRLILEKKKKECDLFVLKIVWNTQSHVRIPVCPETRHF